MAWSFAGVSILFVVLTLGLYYLNFTSAVWPQIQPGQLENIPIRPMNMVMAVTFPPIGALILSRKPRHAVGWIFTLIGLGQATSQLTKQLAVYTLLTYPQALPFGELFYFIQDTLWFPSFGLFVLLLLVFPNGRLLSARWRWILWTLIASLLLFALSFYLYSLDAWRPAYFDTSASIPLRVGDLPFDLAVGLMLLSLFAAAVSLFLRLRRSAGVERQQLKWFAFSGLVFALVFLVLSVLSALPVLYPSVLDDAGYRYALDLVRFIFPITVAGVPIAVGLAILRYRLYDIDLIIRRTLLYTLLTLVLGLIYLVSIGVLQGVFLRFTGRQQSEIVTVLSTLAIAGLFTPLRSRIQETIDLRFYRRKYDAEQTLSAFGASLRDEVDLDTLSRRLVAVIEETMQPQSVSIWLREFEPASRAQSWPAEAE